MSNILAWALTFIGLQAADVVLTVYGLKHGATEANPVALLLIEKLGALPGLTIAKAVGTALIIALASRLRSSQFEAPAQMLTVAVMGAVVGNNAQVVL